MSDPENTSSRKLTNVAPSLAVDQQRQSPLLQLPAELRLMVLREILVSPCTLRHRQWYKEPGMKKEQVGRPPTKKATRIFLPRNSKRKQEYRKEQEIPKQPLKMVLGYHLYPAVLRTCQRLFSDGLPILYGENILGLTCDMNSFSGACWYDMRRRKKGPSAHMITPLVYVRYRQYSSTVEMNDDAKILASRFQKLEVHMPADMFYTLRGFYGTLMAKLQSAVLHEDSSLHVRIGNTIRASNWCLRCVQNAARSFQLLGCKNFTMTGINDKLCQEVVEVITSDLPITDLGASMDRLVPIKTYLFRRPQHLRQEACLKFHDMLGAIEKFDIELFKKTRSDVLKIFEAEVQKLNKMKNDLFESDTWETQGQGREGFEDAMKV